jgi:sterol O-acyltransferase
MKMHSYNSVNGYLKYVSTQADTVLAELRDSAESAGGWEQAMIEAKTRRAELDEATGRSSADDTIEPTPISTPLPSAVQTSYVNSSTANALRNRLNAVSKEAKDFIAQEEEVKEPKVDPAEPHPLIDHPSETIAALATEYSDLRSEMVSTGPEYVQ